MAIMELSCIVLQSLSYSVCVVEYMHDLDITGSLDALMAVCDHSVNVQPTNMVPCMAQCHADSGARQLYVILSGRCWRGAGPLAHVIEHICILSASVRTVTAATPLLSLAAVALVPPVVVA